MHTIKRMVQNVSWLFAGTAITNVISLAVTVFLIRKLPVESFGIYSLFLGSLAIFSIFSINGIIVSLRRFIPEIIQKNYLRYLKSFVKNLYLVSLVLGLVLIAIVYLFRTEVGLLLNIDGFELYYSIFIINIFLYLQSSLNETVLITLYEQKIVAIIGVVSVTVRGVLYLFFLPVITIELIFIIEAISSGVKVIPSLIVVYKKVWIIDSSKSTEIDEEERSQNKKRTGKFILLSTADEMGESGLSEVSDFYLISAFLGVGAMGLYAFPYKFLYSIFNWIPIVTVNQLFKPYFIKNYYDSHENNSYLTQAFNFLLKIYLFLYAILIIYIVAYQDLIHIYIFESKYLETQTLLIVISFLFLLRAFSFPTYLIMEIKEKIQYTLYAKIFAIFNIGVVLFVLTYTNWGLIGVAGATVFSGFLRIYFIYYFMKKFTGVKIFMKGLMKTIAILLLLAACVNVFLFIDNVLVRIIFPPIIGLSLFVFLIKIVNPFNKTDKELLTAIIDALPFKHKFINKIFALGTH